MEEERGSEREGGKEGCIFSYSCKVIEE
jgi:hypothetical protein